VVAVDVALNGLIAAVFAGINLERIGMAGSSIVASSATIAMLHAVIEAGMSLR
jgi:hypothetical protein